MRDLAARGRIVALIVAACGACASARTAAPEASDPQTDVSGHPASFEHVWTAVEQFPIETRVGVFSLSYPFTRLDVLGRGPSGLAVACPFCSPVITGYAPETDIVSAVYPPEVAAWRGLAEFALAIRDAAARNDLEALRPVMASDFTHDFIGVQSPETAFEVWRSEGFRKPRRGAIPSGSRPRHG